MDDGIELNFSLPSGGSASDKAIIKRQSKQKGGRWTDRAQARKDAKATVRQISRRPASPPTAIPAPATISTPVEPFKSAATLPAIPRQAQSRPSTSAPDSHIDTSRDSTFHSRTHNHTPLEAHSKRPRPSQDASASAFESPQPVAGPSRPIASAPKSKPPQIISSLFSSNPKSALPSTSKSKSKSTIGAPSNAPLTGDTKMFAGLGLDPLLVHHLTTKMALKAPTAIQRTALPFMLSQPLDTSHKTFNEDEDDDEDGEAQLAVAPQQMEEAVLRDIFIQSQTGSGKTLTYLLPIIQTLLPLSRLSYIDRSIGTLAIILAPTRELAQQIEKVLEQVLSMALSLPGQDSDSNYTRWLVSGLLTGGSTRTHEKARLRKGVPILVSTPGRLLDHLQNTASFQCSKTLYLVLDEADRLMDLGFEETITGIIRALDGRRRLEIAAEKEQDEVGGGTMRWPFWARGRRTVLCSATVDAKISRLVGAALHDPIIFRGAGEENKDEQEVAGKNEQKKESSSTIVDPNAIELPSMGLDKFTPPSQLSQKYVVVPTKLRLVALVALLRSLVASATPEGGNKIIVFLSSTDAVDFHWKLIGGVKMDNSMPSAIGSDIITLNSPLFQNTTLQRLHGSLPLITRRASLAAFAAPSDSPAILLATSVASRGLDLPLVRAVIQYDLPTEGGANEYVHRVGRTARAGKGGEAWAIVGPAETGWVEWVEKKMGSVGQGTNLGSASVEEVLKKGFGGKGYEYEGRATEVQLAFEKWVLNNDQNSALARKAFASFVRAYSTHPLEEKAFFHTKTLHLGHLAKAFALRDAPSSLAGMVKPGSKKSTDKKRKRGDEDQEDGEAGAKGKDEDDGKGGKERTARNETERRMYEAVRKSGRAVKSGGALGEVGQGTNNRGTGGGAEFQVMGGDEVERMMNRKK